MPMQDTRTYVGIDDDTYGGMSPQGTIIRDAWVFGIIQETEQCKGWSRDRIQALYDKVSLAWAPYGHLASNLSPELKDKHHRIYSAAIARARELGWSPDAELEE